MRLDKKTNEEIHRSYVVSLLKTLEPKTKVDTFMCSNAYAHGPIIRALYIHTSTTCGFNKSSSKVSIKTRHRARGLRIFAGKRCAVENSSQIECKTVENVESRRFAP